MRKFEVYAFKQKGKFLIPVRLTDRLCEVFIMRTGGMTKGDFWLVLTESKQKDNGEWTHECGTEIEGKEVIHSIHDGPFALSGSGKTRRDIVPYCPKCEAIPKGGIINA